MVDSKRLTELSRLNKDVLQCHACSARDEAMDPVPPVGPEWSGIMFVGRNPGKDEDRLGSPFMGPSGKILDEFILACGLERKSIFLTNLILCHTANDRLPVLDEVRTCVSLHFTKYLEFLKPQLVVTLGVEASKYLLGVQKLSDSHGLLFRHRKGFWAIPCFHPGSILYQAQNQAYLDYDAAQVRRFMAHWNDYISELRSQEVDATRATEGIGLT